MARVPIPPARWPTRAEAERSKLFSPLVVGATRLRTRTWVPAMVPWRASAEGFVTPAVLDWYGRFADGRPGALVVEATGIRDVPSGPLLRVGDERFVPGLHELVERVRARSGGETRLFLQVIDFLAIRRRPEAQKYFEQFLELREEHRERLAEVVDEPELAGERAEVVRARLLALSREQLARVLSARELEDLDFGRRQRVTDVHEPEIEALPRTLPPLFAAAARRARAAGFDGLELHFAHAYTMASFLSRTNTRTDGYGTTLAGRVRLPLEVLAAVRAEVGHDWTVGLRFLGDEGIAGGSTLDDACVFAPRFAAAGADFLSLSRGGKFDDAKQPKVGQAAYPYTGPSGLDCMPTVYVEGGPFGRNLPQARAVRAAVRDAGFETPIVACGGINDFERAERALEVGDCDLVGAARQSLADPDWWRKLELGRGAEIRRCLYTNYCEALDQKHVEVTCQLWDREFDTGDPARTQDGKRRLVAPEWPD